MKKLLKVILWLVGLTAVVIIAAVIAVPMFLDPNDHKDRIVQLVKEHTGRDLNLAGDIKLSVFPWLGLDLGPTTLSNAPGFGDQPFVKTERVKVHLALLPLLSKKVELDTVILQGAAINLARGKDGIANWDDLIPEEAPEKPKPAPKEEESPGVQLATLALGGLDIQDASITWNDQSKGQRYVINDFNLETGKLVMNEPIALSLAFRLDESSEGITGDVAMDGKVEYDLDAQRYRLDPIDFNARLKGEMLPGGAVDIDLKSDVAVDLEAATAALENLSFKAMGVEVSGSLQARNILDPIPLIDGQLNVEAGNIANLLKALGQDPATVPLESLVAAITVSSTQETVNVESLNAKLTLAGEQFPDSPVDVNLNTSALVNVTAQTLDVKQLMLQGLGLDLKGVFKGAEIIDNPRFGGAIQLSVKSIPALLKAVGQDPAGVPISSLAMKSSIGATKDVIKLSDLVIRAVVQSKELPSGPVDMTAKQIGIDLNKQTLAANNLSVKGIGIDMLTSVNGTQIIDDPKLAGTLKLAPVNLRALLTQLGQEVPVTADPNVLKSVAVNSQFTASKNDLALKGLSLQLDKTNIKGDLAVANFSDPAINFNINIDAINADRYLPPKSADASPKAVTPEAAAAGAAAELPLDTLRALKAKGNLQIGNLTINDIKLSNVRLGLNARGGKITLHPASAKLFGGSYNGNVTLDATGSQPRVSIDSAINGIKAGDALDALTGESKIDGRLTANAKLTTIGVDPDAIKKTANGTVKFTFSDGAVKGFNIAQIIRDAEAKFTGRSLSATGEAAKTDFSDLSGTVSIASGVVQNTDLAAKSPLMRVTGNGKANLISETIDYGIAATLVGTLKGQGGKGLSDLKGFPIPIRISGTFDKPKFRPDLKGLAEARAKKELEKQKEKIQAKVKDKLEKELGEQLGGQLGDTVGGILGVKPGEKAEGDKPAQTAPQDAAKQKLDDTLKKLLPF